LILAVAFTVGSTMPEKLEVTRSVTINRPPENVFWVLNDYNSLALWHPQYRSTSLISSPGDKPVRWRATYTDGRVANIVVSEDNPPERYAERIADANLPFSGAWVLDMERRDLSTKITAHSISEIHRPLDRLFVHLFVKPELELDRILAGLKRRVESSTVTPTAATS
jgi:uncharacterized protein YndB with AHSA1/START domain